jgi:hypothetical protein
LPISGTGTLLRLLKVEKYNQAFSLLIHDASPVVYLFDD